ncbi:MAG TPA: AMP-binding protein [Dehalococcoidia bacterium]|nr:AMP-binding protein [Dehalococcoidia bacterium]
MLEGCTPWPEEFVKRYVEAGYWAGQTLGEMLDESAERFGPREAVVGDGGTRYTYDDLKVLSDRLALHLLELGLRPADRVLVQLTNVAEFVPLYFGLQKASLIPIMALPPHRLHEMGFFAELSEARAYVLPVRARGFDYTELAQQVQQRAPSVRHVVYQGDGAPPGSLQLEKLLADPIEGRVSPGRLAEVRPDPMEVALFQLSGGTTGVPKLIPRTHNDYIYNSRTLTEILPFDEDSAYLCMIPIPHNYPITAGLQTMLMKGGKIVLSQSPDVEHVMKLIEKEKVTVFPAVPSLLIRFMNDPRFRQHDLSSIKLIISGAQKLQPELKPKLEEGFNARLIEAFGMAEGFNCFNRLTNPLEMRLETVGLPISPDDEVRLLDDDGREVPDGEIGELVTRGPYTLRGYYRAPEHNKAAFTSDGFYRTGDLMRRGPGGGLVVEGRKKDMINRGGEHISAEEIENLVLTHPAVHNVAVIGMPDPEMGERLCAYVILRPGQSLTFQELCSFLLGKQIAKFKLPERLELVGEFPLTNIGKVSKKDLREDIARKLKGQS